MLLLSQNTDNRYKAILLLIVLIFAVFFVWFALREFNHGLEDGFDKAFYRQSAWSTLQGKLLWSSLLGAQGASDLKTHGHFTLAFFSPLFFIFNPIVTFTVTHAVLLAAGALPLYLIARRKINAAAGLFFALLYLTNPFTIQSLVEGFQMRSLSAPFFLLAFYLLLEKRYLGFNLALIFLALSHEINCLVIFMLGIYVALVVRRMKHGLLIALFSLIWFIFLLKVVFTGLGNKFPLELLQFSPQGQILSGSGQIISYCLTHPAEILQSCLAAGKPEYLLRLFLPLGFLPLFSPWELMIGLPVILQNVVLSQHLVSLNSPRYTMTLLPFIFISAVYSLAYLLEKFKALRVYIILFLIFTWFLSLNKFILDAKYNPGFSRVLAPLPQEEAWHWEQLKRIAGIIPPDASVSADIKALPFLADRFLLYAIPLQAEETQYVLLDTKKPQMSRIAVSLGITEKDYLRMREAWLSSDRHKIIEESDGIFLIQKLKNTPEPDNP